MVKTALNKTKIRGIVSVVPKRELSLLDNPHLYNGNEKKIKRVIESSGFLKRRVTNIKTTTSDLCEYAAKKLLSKLSIEKETIDGLLFVSYTPDYIMPATSYVLHKKLGLSENCIVADIPQACSGYVFGLYQAAMMINSGCKRVLLLVGDTFSKFSDMFNDNTAPVFGDAGSATLIDYDDNAGPMYFNIKSDGQHYDALISNNGGFRNIISKDDFYANGDYKYSAKMNGAEIFTFAMEKISPSIEEILEFANVKKDEINHYVLHQANKFILQNIAMQLEIQPNLIPAETLSKYGNQCGASIPCTISDQLEYEVSNNNNKILLSGFGVGLSWISAIVDINQIYCSKILEYGENYE